VELGDRKKSPAYPFFQYSKLKGVSIVFPPRTAGYFYYCQPNVDLPFTGAIRFRIASVNPATFAKGRDLLRPDGVPWEVSLPMISKTRPVLKQLLLRDGLVTESQLEKCVALAPSRQCRPQTLLHSFDQPFSVKFDAAHYVQAVCGDQKYSVDIRVFHEQRASPVYVYPYSGQFPESFRIAMSSHLR
jgi:hypothetical protein